MIEANSVHEGKLDKERYIHSRQSANVLFKFMKRIDYLKNIIENKAILPRYYEESIEYLEIDGLNKIAFPMICFCDINLSKLEEHVYYYGKFGIGLSKKWAIENGVQPIHYINKNSYIKKDISYLFSKSLDNKFKDINETQEYKNYILEHVLFMKPILGQMRREGGYDEKNFTDEKEWRYIPRIEEEQGIDLIIPVSYLENDEAYNAYSDGITQLEKLWLYFKISDIEYLMVENEEYRIELIEFILNNKEIDKLDRYVLISKIIVYDIMNKDW